MSTPAGLNSLLDRISSGEKAVTILLSLLPDDERTSLARCAAVRIFDAGAYDLHLRSGSGEPTQLAELVARGWVEESAGEVPRYHIAGHLRDEAWNLWQRDVPPGTPEPPAELADLSARLAGYFGEIGWPVEQLRQLTIADQAEAERVFDKVYRAADERFDLAYCQDLVDALSEPERDRFLSQGLRDRRDDGRRRIAARAMRATEYYQTAPTRYQPRLSVEAEFLRLLNTRSPARLLQLHGHGGTGKSTLLHWFTARQCVLREPLVACARINCDTLDPVAALKQPWLLLIEAADQLDRQLPGAPFLRLLDSFRDYRGRLYRPPAMVEAVGTDQRRSERIPGQVEEEFCIAFAGGPPALIALDGLDEIATRSRAAPEPLQALVDLLIRLLDTVDNLRIVLAGRDDLSQLVPRLRAEPGRMLNVPVPSFNEEEAAQYLHRRQVPGDERRRAIFQRSRGLPMVVALYADLIEKEPRLTAREIEQHTEPQIEYLITRILNHIKDPLVRGALLYSVVVPSELTFDFFCDIMLPLWRVQAAEAGIPNELTPAERPARPDVPGSDDHPRLQQLWKDVVAQAAMSTWISPTEVGDQQAIIIHSDVRVRMRNEVRGHKTFSELHGRAAAHYQERADAILDGRGPGDYWRGLTELVIYHRFQQQDRRAADCWREAVAQARSLRQLESVRSLGGYLLDPGFQDDEGNPDVAVLGYQVLYEAHVERARVSAQDAGMLPGGHTGPRAVPWLLEAQGELAQAGLTRQRALAQGQPVRRADYEVIVAALIDVESGQSGAALGRLDGFDTSSGSALGDVWLVRARARASHIDIVTYPETPDAALLAYEAAGDHQAESANLAYVTVEAARWLLRIDRPDLSLEWGDRAWRTRPDDALAESVAEVRARALLALGRPASALAALESPRGQPSAGRVQRLAAEAQLALWRPGNAAKELSSRTGINDDGDSVEGHIEHGLLAARVFGELFDIDRAVDYFNQAQAHLSSQPDEIYQARINTARGLFELKVMGSVNDAKTYLVAPELEFSGLPPGGPTWTGLQLARAELADREQRAEDARQILDEVREKLMAAKAPASIRARVALAGVAARSIPWSFGRRNYLQQLNDELKAIVPEARLSIVAELLRCRPADHNRKLAHRLCTLVTAADAAEEAETTIDGQTDQAWRDLVMAQLFLVTGDPPAATRRRAAALVTLRSDPFIRWCLLDADDSREIPPDPEALPPDPYQFHEHYGDHPVLFAAFMAKWARRYDASRSGEEAYLWLREAKRTLDDWPTRRRSIWHARLYEALAERAGDRGDEATGIVDKAAEIRAELGDHEVRPETAREWLAPPGTIQAAVTELILSDDQKGNDLRISQHRASDGPSRRVEVFRAESKLLDTSHGLYTPALSWGEQAGAALANSLGPLFVQEAPGTIDIRVELSVLGLAANPWELVMAEDVPLAAHPKVRFIFRGTNDALSQRHQWQYLRSAMQELKYTVDHRIGEITHPAVGDWLTKFHRRHGLDADPVRLRPETWRAIRMDLRKRPGRIMRPLRVHIVQPMVGGDLDTYRGLGTRIQELNRIYLAHGIDSRIIDGAQVGDLFHGEPDSVKAPPDVLHVCTVMEATEQLPVIGLDATSGPPLTAPELDLLVSNLTRTIPPLVVLDVQAPPGPVEIRRQLLMRNRFAHQMLALGGVSTILATGLTSTDPAAQWRFIAEGLAKQRNAAEICRKIQLYSLKETREPVRAEDEDAHAVAFTATALFTSVHADSLLEPGLLT